MNILILGCGQLGQALAQKLYARGHHVTTVSRSAKPLTHGIVQLQQNIHHLDLSDHSTVFDWVYIILSPDKNPLNPSRIESYQHTFIETIVPIYQALSAQPIQRVIYISSTRVYGENQGNIVNDLTIPYAPADPLAQVLIAAEHLQQAYWQDKLTIIRPSGLYNGLSPRLQQQAKDLDMTIDHHHHHYMNIIHREDVVSFLFYLTQLDSSQYQKNQTTHIIQPSYILSSPKPQLRHDFLNHIRQQMGLVAIDSTASDMDDILITGKRLQIQRVLATGFQFTHYFLK